MNKTTIQPFNKEELQAIINQAIEEHGNAADLNFIDTSRITDVSYLFIDSPFNGDISQWDVSSVRRMDKMFKESAFNGDISQWDVRELTNMMDMFEGSAFRGNISYWDIPPGNTGNNCHEFRALRKRTWEQDQQGAIPTPKDMPPPCKPKTKKQLRAIITKTLQEHGNNADLRAPCKISTESKMNPSSLSIVRFLSQIGTNL
ncbi:MAG: BspA family leucine-rich repeat surface protein [Akkermansia sp.]